MIPKKFAPALFSLILSGLGHFNLSCQWINFGLHRIVVRRLADGLAGRVPSRVRARTSCEGSG